MPLRCPNGASWGAQRPPRRRRRAKSLGRNAPWKRIFVTFVRIYIPKGERNRPFTAGAVSPRPAQGLRDEKVKRVNECNYGNESAERKKGPHLRGAQRTVHRLEGRGTRGRGGRRNRADEYRGVDPHGYDRPPGRKVRHDRRARRRHARRGPRTADRPHDRALRRAFRLHAPLDRHVAQRAQGAHLRRSGLRLPPEDARHLGHLVPQGHTGRAQEGCAQRVGLDRGALLHRRAAHVVRLQRHGRRQGAARIHRPQLRLHLRPREARAHQHRVAVAHAHHGGPGRVGHGRADGVRREHVAAGQRFGRGVRRLRADALFGLHAQGDHAEPLPRRRLLVDGHEPPRHAHLRKGPRFRGRVPEPPSFGRGGVAGRAGNGGGFRGHIVRGPRSMPRRGAGAGASPHAMRRRRNPRRPAAGATRRPSRAA